jgi:hypothetical protein
MDNDYSPVGIVDVGVRNMLPQIGIWRIELTFSTEPRKGRREINQMMWLVVRPQKTLRSRTSELIDRGRANQGGYVNKARKMRCLRGPFRCCNGIVRLNWTWISMVVI